MTDPDRYRDARLSLFVVSGWAFTQILLFSVRTFFCSSEGLIRKRRSEKLKDRFDNCTSLSSLVPGLCFLEVVRLNCIDLK